MVNSSLLDNNKIHLYKLYRDITKQYFRVNFWLYISYGYVCWHPQIFLWIIQISGFNLLRTLYPEILVTHIEIIAISRQRAGS